MKKNLKQNKRNWGLIFIASILIAIGLVLMLIAVIYFKQLGWYSVLIELSGIMTVGTSIMSIVKNDPSWILLNLILPN